MEKLKKKRDRDSVVFKDWFVCIIDIEREKETTEIWMTGPEDINMNKFIIKKKTIKMINVDVCALSYWMEAFGVLYNSIFLVITSKFSN